MPAQLIAIDEGLRILLDKPILLLGRDAECDIQFDSRKISRRHCCLAQVGDRLVVRDLGSTNGIRINGVRVVEGHLKAGDELSIGNHRYRVSWDEPGSRPPRPKQQRLAEPREPEKKWVSPGRPAPLDDELLEACDDPVPLPDPVERPVGSSPPNAAPPPAALPADPSPPMARPGLSFPPILPEHLELAASDSFPPVHGAPPSP